MEGVLFPTRRGLPARLWLWLAGRSPDEASDRPLEDAALVLRRHGDAILRLAFSYLHRRDEAEDVLQDTLLQYIQKAPPFSSREHEKAWLLRVAANLSKNRLSYWRRHPQEELSDLLPGQEQEPQLSAVWDCVKALPPKYRAVVHLYYYEQYSTVEIAKLLDKKESTVRSLLTRARGLLRDELEEDDLGD